MKRLLSILLVALMLLPMASGLAAAAPEKITILYPGEESDRMTSFLQGEFKEKLLADLNMEVDMIFVPWDLYWDKKDIMLASQEPIDLYWDGLPDLANFVNKKQCQPLDELIEQYGQDMLKVLPMEQLNGGKVDGIIYGIPSAYAPSACMFQFVCLRQDLLESVGMSEVKTPQDLFDFAKAVKEADPVIKGGGDPLIKPMARYFSDEQFTWIAYAELVVFGEETHKAYSFFETEAFQNYAKFNRQMSLAGLYSDDETLKYNERDTRLQTGNYLWVEGSLGKDLEVVDAVRSNAPEAVLQNYLLAPEKPKYITAAGGEVLCIPYTAPNPAGAMKFLNWLYSSPENYTFCLYGVEGVDYQIVDGRIERLISDELFYEWMFRNKNYQMFAPDVPQEYIDLCATWDDDALVSKSFGFRFNNEKVADVEVKLMEAMKLLVPLETGFVDFDTEYPKAVQQLKAAGIDEYVAEVQRQLDEFLAE